MNNTLYTLSACLLTLPVFGKDLNLAKPEVHPYADPTGGREQHTLTDETVNEARLYDFYNRQAQYYMAKPKTDVPNILPAYPGLDANKHGHWGKYNQNNHRDERWNEMDNGGVLAGRTFFGKTVINKGVNVTLGEYTACFDPQVLQYSRAWKGSTQFDGYRWGLSRGIKTSGDIIHEGAEKMSAEWKALKYHGFYRFGDEVIFSYIKDGKEVLDQPNMAGEQFSPIREVVGQATSSLSKKLKGGPLRWPETYTVKGERAPDDKAYVIDTIPLPFDNAYNSGMLLGSLDFLSDGRALIATLWGDVWLVSGLDDKLNAVTWKRFAAGLSQPFGIKVEDDQIYVLCKDQVTILHDYNQDGEADFYQNRSNDWEENHGHTHVFGLDRDKDGNMYFPAYDIFVKVPGDGGPSEVFAHGFRNCMGSSVREDGLVLASSQEGIWTPASQIIEVTKGSHYGHKRSNQPIEPAMVWIPRGIDNSTGGMEFVNSDRWGPLGHSLLGFSYGYGRHYLILMDESHPRRQGATVELDGDFSSGLTRGRINPVDGQLYVVGTEGWGNYAVEDGCFNRIRYTGKSVYKPIGFQVHYNGLRIDFTDAIDPASAKDVSNYFCQQWNYEYDKRYGSPEFSVYHPDQLGHDPLDVTQVTILDDGKSIFVEIPWIMPTMQLHLHMKLKAADGHAFNTDIYPTVHHLGSPHTFAGMTKIEEGKPTVLQHRIKAKSKDQTSNTAIEGARRVTIKPLTGLRFDVTEITAKPNEALEIEFINNDIMPHNWVLLQPGAKAKIGEAAFKMISDPKVAEKHYVPELPEVITYTHMVFPQKRYSLFFRTPKEPGSYPYICTFPGHWQAMQGVLIVK